MALSNDYQSLKLLLSLVNNQVITKPIITFPPEKTEISSKTDSIKLIDRVSPEEIGVDSKRLESFYNEISLDDSIKLNRLLILKENKVIFEKCEEPYDLKGWNYCFSFTKSIIGLGIGILVDEGKLKLTDKAYKILLPKANILNIQNKKITVKDLLTMSTGVKFNEASAAVSKEWVKDFFNTSNKFKPSTSFEYNSLNTYILSAIIHKITGSCGDFLNERIFKPLGIKDYLFENSPEGIKIGGWGIYLAIDDMAKIALLVQNNGKYKNHRIVSKEWIKEMTSCQNDIKLKGQEFDYGYQIWVSEDRGISCMNGLFDQDAIMFKKSGYTLVWTSSNNDGFHTNNIFSLASKYFENPDTPYDYIEYSKTDITSDMSSKKPLDHMIGKKFILSGKKGIDTTVLPVVLQCILNQYSKGLESIEFKENDSNEYSLIFKEKDYPEYEIKYSTEKEIYQVLELYGQKYELSAKGFYRKNDYGENYLLIRLNFLEYASTRYLKIYMTPNYGEIIIRIKENPGLQFFFNLLQFGDKQVERLVSFLNKTLGEESIVNRVSDFISPSFKMKIEE